MDTIKATETANQIISLYEKHGGSDYAGEKVTQLEHMVQAAELAERNGYEEDVILSAFLHDIGHICVSAAGDNQMDGYGIRDHEDVGAEYLKEKGFSEKVTQLVNSHVDAKRYLIFSNKEYYDELSDASKRTLEFQGGKMSNEEASRFEQHPLFNQFIRLRRWDEEAKVENLPITSLDHYREMIISHLSTQLPGAA